MGRISVILLLVIILTIQLEIIARLVTIVTMLQTFGMKALSMSTAVGGRTLGLSMQRPGPNDPSPMILVFLGSPMETEPSLQWAIMGPFASLAMVLPGRRLMPVQTDVCDRLSMEAANL
jgi:hypothetical protein